jgi:SAM-dependent methyltransferase
MEFDVSATFNDDYLYFYAESTDEGHTDDDAAEILGLLQLPPGARILDAPCGPGRIARRLAAAGMVVTGVDLSKAFIELARAEPRPGASGGAGSDGSSGDGSSGGGSSGGAGGPGPAPEYLVGDMRRLPVDGPFDAAVCWFASFGYYDDDDCRTVLSEFHRVLRPGGSVVIETMHHDGVVRNFTAAPEASVVTRGDDAQVDYYRFEPLTGRIGAERTVYRDGATRRSAHYIRLPTPPEWVQWLEAAGFRDVQFFAGGGGALTLDSWVMVVRATA